MKNLIIASGSIFAAFLAPISPTYSADTSTDCYEIGAPIEPQDAATYDRTLAILNQGVPVRLCIEDATYALESKEVKDELSLTTENYVVLRVRARWWFEPNNDESDRFQDYVSEFTCVNSLDTANTLVGHFCDLKASDQKEELSAHCEKCFSHQRGASGAALGIRLVLKAPENAVEESVIDRAFVLFSYALDRYHEPFRTTEVELTKL